MARNTSFTMGFPPFRGAVREIILASTVIYIFILLTWTLAHPISQAVLDHGILDPGQVRGAPIMLFPLPIQIPVKWIVLFGAAIETAYLLLSGFALFYWVLLLGLGAGYVWYTLFLTRGSTVRISEKYFSIRNSYYRWRRRRAA